ncbi:DUF3592 domain-containing protein [Marinicellulosiphila megalodicopiae]|uniref:DUF3592 domain-containing protein n=1 Tax=Marinicellulosiphila megalodicopiae TaxID=2724896 RepID=UPI003BAF7669
MFTAIVSIVILLKSKNWTPIDATAVNNNIAALYYSPNSAMANSNTTDYKLTTNYRYSVKGQNYTGNTLYAGLPKIFDSKLEAEQLSQQFPAGQKTKAYYNPKNPAESALLLTREAVRLTGSCSSLLCLLWLRL